MNLYGTNEAAAYLGLAVVTVKKHVKNHQLRPQLIGKSLVFTQDELDRFQREKRRPGRPTGTTSTTKGQPA